MGSDTCRIYLQNISRHLIDFENQPKTIERNLVREWFNIGENLFEEIYSLGSSVKWNAADIKQTQPELVDITTRITINQGWLQSFITIYPGIRVDLEGVTPAVNVCRVRSGIEFLLRDFINVSKSFDKVLVDLKELGEVEEFDEHLKVWQKQHRPDFFPGDRNPNIPKSHWWWF